MTEGNVYRPPNTETAQLKLTQETDHHRASIATLLDRMGLQPYGDGHRVEFSSTLLGRLFERLGGKGWQNKRLPAFVWRLPRDQQRLLMDVLIRGDGNERNTYYTGSDRLAADVCRLCVELGMKPRYTHRDGIWQIYVREVNDGFVSRDHVCWMATDNDLYRLTVEDYSAVMAGRNGRFQWIGVSNIS